MPYSSYRSTSDTFVGRKYLTYANGAYPIIPSGALSDYAKMDSQEPYKVANLVICGVDEMGGLTPVSGTVSLNFNTGKLGTIPNIVSVELDGNTTAFVSDVNMYIVPGDSIEQSVYIENDTDGYIMCGIDFTR